MRSVFSPWAYGESAADLDRAEGMLGLVVTAAVAPFALAWLLGTLADAAVGSASPVAAALWPLLVAGASLVRWVGLAVLTLLVPVYLALSVAQLRRCHGCSRELSGWALLEVYVACAAAGIVGFALLT